MTLKDKLVCALLSLLVTLGLTLLGFGVTIFGLMEGERLAPGLVYFFIFGLLIIFAFSYNIVYHWMRRRKYGED